MKLRSPGPTPHQALTLGMIMALSFALVSPLSQDAIAQQTRPVPKASCGSGDRTESGLQGQTTLSERFSGPPMRAYNCNLELVGQFEGEGASWHLAAFDNCVYYSTTPNPAMKNLGTVVVDASDSRQPRATAYLNSKTMAASNESLEVHPERKILVGNVFNGPTFEIYDLSADCRRPTLKSSIDLPGITVHGGGFTEDGRTYYGANFPMGTTRQNDVAVVALDVTDPSKPRELARWNRPDTIWNPHAVTVRRDGNRIFLVANGNNTTIPNGVVILDTSDIQARRPNAQIRLVSTLFWTDGGGGQFATPLTINGRLHLAVSETSGSSDPRANCARGLPPYGVARLVDISDEKNPKTVSKLMLEIHDPANCSKVVDASVWDRYGSSYCTPDNDRDAKLLACAYLEAGLRVFDIRDPTRPREIAYYKPAARLTELRPGSFYSPFGSGVPGRPNALPRSNYHTTDSVAMPLFHKNGNEIWFLSYDGGFHIVRFSDRLKAAEKALFRN